MLTILIMHYNVDAITKRNILFSYVQNDTIILMLIDFAFTLQSLTSFDWNIKEDPFSSLVLLLLLRKA